MLGLFMNQDSELAMETGAAFLKIVSPFYFVISVKLLADGVLRGAEAMKEFMMSTFSDLILRVVLAYVLMIPFGTSGIWMSWPIGWMIGTILSFGFYKQGKWMKKSMVAIEEKSDTIVVSNEKRGNYAESIRTE